MKQIYEAILFGLTATGIILLVGLIIYGTFLLLGELGGLIAGFFVLVSLTHYIYSRIG